MTSGARYHRVWTYCKQDKSWSQRPTDASTVRTGRTHLCHEARLSSVGLCGPDRSSESKVADLEVAVGVEEEIARLEIAVDDVGRVHRLESSQCLVDKVLAVVVREVLRADDAVHLRGAKEGCQSRLRHTLRDAKTEGDVRPSP